MRSANAKSIDQHHQAQAETDNAGISKVPAKSVQPAQSSRTVDWLTAAEAASHLKVQTRTLLLWTRQGKVQAFALSGTKRRVWRYRRDDLDQLLLNHPVLSSKSLSVLSEGRLQ